MNPEDLRWHRFQALASHYFAPIPGEFRDRGEDAIILDCVLSFPPELVPDYGSGRHFARDFVNTVMAFAAEQDHPETELVETTGGDHAAILRWIKRWFKKHRPR